jgi:hypothetical protein
MTLSNADEAKAKARADFMQRFFAVAVSAGFAAKINGLSFIYSMTLPTQGELQDVLLLVLAMSVVVGSWDFYFIALKDRPLVDWQRFVLDIVIVSLYIILLISSRYPSAFFMYLCVVIFLYFVWDVLSIKYFPSVYEARSAEASEVARVVFHGIATRGGRAGDGPVGPFVSLWWLCTFLFVFEQVILREQASTKYILRHSSHTYCIDEIRRSVGT